MEEKKEKKKKNAFVRFFCAIGRGINYFFCLLFFGIIVLFAKIFFRCKVRGKENVKNDDEARVFIFNHYELYGPVAMYIRFPYKNRPWIIDKMMLPESIDRQMSLMIMNNFKKVPKWLKRFVIVCIKNLVVFVMNFVKGIPVSRENFRFNLKTMQISTETLEKGKCLAIFPEKNYVKEGVGEFQSGFEHIGKYYYQKTGKKISFYPVFVSQINKEMYIEKPIVFNPETDTNEEKVKIVTYLRQTMLATYEEKEVQGEKYKKHKLKQQKKEEKQKLKEQKKREKQEKLKQKAEGKKKNLENKKSK